jgi:hypothetical protein
MGRPSPHACAERVLHHHHRRGCSGAAVCSFIGGFIRIPATVMIVCALTLATIPFAFLLKDPRLGAQPI